MFQLFLCLCNKVLVHQLFFGSTSDGTDNFSGSIKFVRKCGSFISEKQFLKSGKSSIKGICHNFMGIFYNLRSTKYFFTKFSDI